jgi:regulator of protease activity HflC (stomatin/prohibitin superfamily)
MAASLDAERQIRQMADFIELEAKEKASEIRAKAKADADAERQLAITSAKAKIAEEFDKKERNLATEKKMCVDVENASGARPSLLTAMPSPPPLLPPHPPPLLTPPFP